MFTKNVNVFEFASSKYIILLLLLIAVIPYYMRTKGYVITIVSLLCYAKTVGTTTVV